MSCPSQAREKMKYNTKIEGKNDYDMEKEKRLDDSPNTPLWIMSSIEGIRRHNRLVDSSFQIIRFGGNVKLHNKSASLLSVVIVPLMIHNLEKIKCCETH